MNGIGTIEYPYAVNKNKTTNTKERTLIYTSYNIEKLTQNKSYS